MEALGSVIEDSLLCHLCMSDRLLLATQGKIVQLFLLLRQDISVFESSVLHVKCALAPEAGESNLSATSSWLLLHLQSLVSPQGDFQTQLC